MPPVNVLLAVNDSVPVPLTVRLLLPARTLEIVVVPVVVVVSTITVPPVGTRLSVALEIV